MERGSSLWIAVVLMLLGHTRAWCPDPTQVAPCLCYERKNGDRLDLYCHEVELPTVQSAMQAILDNDSSNHLHILSITDSDIPTLPAQAFPITDIEEISITFSSLTLIDDNAFVQQTPNNRLKVLELVGNKLTNIPTDATDISKLPNLKRLDLSFNEIASIPPDTFIGFNQIPQDRQLEYLLFKGNKITSLQPRAFAGLSRVLAIHLEENQIRDVQPNLLEGVGTTSQIIVRIILDYNSISELQGNLLPPNTPGVDFFPAFRFGYNNITDISAITQYLPRFLTDLSFRGNKIPSLDAGALPFPFLCHLDLSDNQIAYMDRTVFQDSTNILHLRLQDNQLSTIEDETFDALRLPYELDLGRNKLERITSGTFSNVVETGLVFLQDNSILTIADGAFTHASKMESIYLQNNNIQSIGALTFTGCDSLKVLALDNNNIKTIDSSALQPLVHLKTLRINNNQLHSINNNLFVSQERSLEYIIAYDNQLDTSVITATRNLMYLRHINFANNLIETIAEEAFRYHTMLTYIIGFDNNIASIGKHAFLSHRELDLRDNNIQSFPSTAFVPGHRSPVILLDGNQNLTCDCNINWMMEDPGLSGGRCGSPPHLAGELVADVGQQTCLIPTLTITNTWVDKYWIMIQWQVTDITYVSGFVVKYAEYGTYDYRESSVLRQTRDDYTINNLDSYKQYHICVTAQLSGDVEEYGHHEQTQRHANSAHQDCIVEVTLVAGLENCPTFAPVTESSVACPVCEEEETSKIAGITVGCTLAGLFLVELGGYWMLKRNRRKNKNASFN